MSHDKVYFLTGNLIKLRAIEPDDLPVIYQWYNAQKLTQNTSHHRYPNTLEKQEKFYQSCQSDPAHLSLAVITKEKIVGTVTLLHINHFDQKAEMAVHVFDQTKDKTKIALEAVMLLIHHGFYNLNLNKIYSGMMEGLAGWVVLLVDFFGFQHEGIRRQDIYKEGRFQDVIQVSLLRSEFEMVLKKTKRKPLDFSIHLK